MRRVLRVESNDAYWDRRWREAGRDADSFDDVNVYPIKFAEMVVGRDETVRVLELGCGLGRVLKHYHHRGVCITGVERSRVAVEQLRAEDASLNVREGDARDLPIDDAAFDVVLAFGVYHNIEVGLDAALAETARVLKPGGRFCISMRPDNLEMRANEWYWRWRRWRTGERGGQPSFHKWLVRPSEFTAMLADHGLATTAIHTAQNVSLLYRLPMLRARQRGESARRSQGYRLNMLGRAVDGLTRRLMPSQRANVLVFVGHRSEKASGSGETSALRREWHELKPMKKGRERQAVRSM